MAYAGTERRTPPPWYLDPRLLIALLTAGVTSGSTAIWWASDMKHIQIDHGRQIVETQARVAALDFSGKLVDRLWPNPEQRDAAKLELLKMQQTGELAQLAAETDIAKAQIAVNQVEAQSSSLFVAGGRPFAIWVCGAAFAYHYIAQPFLAFMFAAAGHTVPLPVFDMDELMTVLLGLLGLGGMRSFDKVKGAR